MSFRIEHSSYQWMIEPIQALTFEIMQHLEYANAVATCFEFLADEEMKDVILTKLKVSTSYRSTILDLAKKERQSKYKTLNREFVIVLYSFLEAGINDLIKKILLSGSEFVVTSHTDKIKIPATYILDHDKKDAIELFYKEYFLANKTFSGYRKFNELLQIVGLDTDKSELLSKDDKNNITELAQIRNVCLHKAGIIDEQLIERCGWIKKHKKARIGDAVEIDFEDINRYNTSVLNYLTSIRRRVEEIVEPIEAEIIKRDEWLREKYKELSQDPGEQ